MSWKNITTVADLEAIVGQPSPMILRKEISALDDGCRTVLARSPLAAAGYRDPGGVSRTTFAGGAPGFARATSTAPRPSCAPACGSRPARPHRPPPRRPPQSPAPAAAHPPDAATPAGPLADPEVAAFLDASMFLALSSWDGAGGSDTSPRGDQQAVARILDGRTLVIPDRRGNKRADTLHNLLHDDRVSGAALVPGRDEVLHLRGRGMTTSDPALLATMALRGTPPHLALVIDVEHAEVTANNAVARSRLWDPGAHLPRGATPDLMALAGGQLATNSTGVLPALLQRVIATPGMPRLLRWVMNRAYRAGLRHEGYDAQ